MPAAGYPLHTDRRHAASAAATRWRALRALARAARAFLRARALLRSAAPRRRDGRRRLRRRARSASRPSTRRIPLVLTEADSHLGPRQPRARAGRAARLPRVPASRAAAGVATASPVGRSRRRRPTAPAARARLGIEARRDLRARLRRLARRALDQPRGDRGLRGRGLPRAARLRAPRLPGAERRGRGPRATTCASTSTSRTSPMRSRPPTSSSRAPGGSLFEIAAHGRPAILVPYPHAAADHQSANARWMARGRRRDRASPTAS